MEITGRSLMNSAAPAASWSAMPDPADAAADWPSHMSVDTFGDGNADECEVILNSMSQIASSMESRIEELAHQCNVAPLGHDQALMILGNLEPLQERLQCMHSNLLDFGRRLRASSDVGSRDASVSLQHVGAAVRLGTTVAEEQVVEEQVSMPVRRVAILTFARWSSKSTEALQQAGFIKSRGQAGCIYTADLLPFQRQYLEQRRRLCIYHVVAEEHHVSEVSAVVAMLRYAERSKLKQQEVVQLPTIEDAWVRGQQTASSSAASSTSLLTSIPPGCSAARSVPGSSTTSFVSSRGNAFHSGDDYYAADQRREGDPREHGPTAMIEHSTRAGPQRGGTAERGGVAWTVLSFYSF